jgi:hypothetical protein
MSLEHLQVCSLIAGFPGRWLPFLAEVHQPPTTDQVGKLCAVGLEDGRVMVRTASWAAPALLRPAVRERRCGLTMHR